MSAPSPKGRITPAGKYLIGLGVAFLVLAIAGLLFDSGSPRSNEHQIGQGIGQSFSVVLMVLSFICIAFGACLRNK